MNNRIGLKSFGGYKGKNIESKSPNLSLNKKMQETENVTKEKSIQLFNNEVIKIVKNLENSLIFLSSIQKDLKDQKERFYLVEKTKRMIICLAKEISKNKMK